MSEEIQTIHLEGLEEHQGRLDVVLSQILPDISRASIQKQIKQGLITVNGQEEKANFKLKGDEEITLIIPEEEEEEELEITPQDMDLDIVYEDDDLLVINKPENMVVHPSKGHPNGTLVNGLLAYLKDSLSQGSESYRPGIVHRIDKDTSGLLVVAKTNQAHQALSQQLADHTMERTYIALVNGPMEAESGKIEMPVRRDPSNRLRWIVDQNGKPALTEFQVIKSWPYATLVQLNLHTGRTHQIRIHLEAIGHPIIGDPIYRRNMQNFPGDLSRLNDGQLLHAQRLAFNHPRTGKRVEFTSEIPARIQAEAEKLDNLL